MRRIEPPQVAPQLERSRRDATDRSQAAYPLMFITRSRGDAALVPKRLARYVEELGFKRAHVVSSARAAALMRELDVVGHDPIPSIPTEFEARRLAQGVRHGPADVVLGVGGGLALDIAKVVASAAELPMLAVPTQLSHDGFASPVAILVDGQGRKRTVAVRTPEAVLLSLPTLATAPNTAFAAGLGDLISNEFALRDWQLAEDRGRDIVDPEAWCLSTESLELIQPLLERDPRHASRDPVSLALLGTALVNSGRAMLVAGSSRPASGAEHKISHAIDSVLGSRALHGAQVAFACLISAHMQDADVGALRGTLRRLSLPTHPHELRMTRTDLRGVLLHASRLRPERYTILDETPLDDRRADVLINELWPEV